MLLLQENKITVAYLGFDMLTCLRVQNLLVKFWRTERDGGSQVLSFVFILPFWEWSLMPPDPKSESDRRSRACWLAEDKIMPAGY